MEIFFFIPYSSFSELKAEFSASFSLKVAFVTVFPKIESIHFVIKPNLSSFPNKMIFIGLSINLLLLNLIKLKYLPIAIKSCCKNPWPLLLLRYRYSNIVTWDVEANSLDIL